MKQLIHQSVMLKEALQALAIKPDGIYVDATFGRGGHSRAILQSLATNGQLIAFDRDAQAIESAPPELRNDKRFKLAHSPFSEMAEILSGFQLLGKVHGILFDFGVSSPQLDDASRGFSFLKNGELDMRMDVRQSMSARTWLNHAAVSELNHVFQEYGEEKFSRRIAEAIVNRRTEAEIVTTQQLVEIIEDAIPYRDKHKHPATRVFQAIRIFINDELNEIDSALKQCLDILQSGGRLVTICFHSLEDRIVKQFVKLQSCAPQVNKNVPITSNDFKPFLKKVSKAIKPTADEMKENPRARSAILRVAEKI